VKPVYDQTTLKETFLLFTQQYFGCATFEYFRKRRGKKEKCDDFGQNEGATNTIDSSRSGNRNQSFDRISSFHGNHDHVTVKSELHGHVNPAVEIDGHQPDDELSQPVYDSIETSEKVKCRPEKPFEHLEKKMDCEANAYATTAFKEKSPAQDLKEANESDDNVSHVSSNDADQPAEHLTDAGGPRHSMNEVSDYPKTPLVETAYVNIAAELSDEPTGSSTSSKPGLIAANPTSPVTNVDDVKEPESHSSEDEANDTEKTTEEAIIKIPIKGIVDADAPNTQDTGNDDEIPTQTTANVNEAYEPDEKETSVEPQVDAAVSSTLFRGMFRVDTSFQNISSII